MPVAAAPRHEAVEHVGDVGDDVRVGVLVDRDAGRGVRHEDGDRAFLDVQLAQGLFDVAGNIHEFGSSVRCDRNLFHRGSILFHSRPIARARNLLRRAGPRRERRPDK